MQPSCTMTSPPVWSRAGNDRQLLRIKDLVNQLSIPDAPYIIFATRLDYAATHPMNIKAFLAAYRDAIGIMNSDDAAWVEAAKTLKIVDPDIVGKFRDQTRSLFVPAFSQQLRRTSGVPSTFLWRPPARRCLACQNCRTTS